MVISFGGIWVFAISIIPFSSEWILYFPLITLLKNNILHFSNSLSPIKNLKQCAL